MSSRKDEDTKKLLARRAKANKRVPLWVMIKTNRAVSQNQKQYHWRRSKLGHKVRLKLKESKGDN